MKISGNISIFLLDLVLYLPCVPWWETNRYCYIVCTLWSVILCYFVFWMKCIEGYSVKEILCTILGSRQCFMVFLVSNMGCIFSIKNTKIYIRIIGLPVSKSHPPSYILNINIYINSLKNIENVPTPMRLYIMSLSHF